MPKLWRARREARSADHEARFEFAWRQLQRVWGSEGLRAAGEVLDALRLLDGDQLEVLEARVPKGTGLTELKCNQARDLVHSVAGGEVMGTIRIEKPKGGKAPDPGYDSAPRKVIRWIMEQAGYPDTFTTKGAKGTGTLGVGMGRRQYEKSRKYE